jgi:Putative binding domain, N-terminal
LHSYRRRGDVMKLSLPRRLVLPLQIACIAALVAVTSACDNNPSSPTTTGGCQVITGNTTTSFPASGGSSTVSVRTPSTCTWGAVSNASFVTITQGASGAGDGTIGFSVAANSGAQRTAAVTVTDSNTAFPDTVITITQSAP